MSVVDMPVVDMPVGNPWLSPLTAEGQTGLSGTKMA